MAEGPLPAGIAASALTTYPLIGGLVAFVGLGGVIFGALFFAPAQTRQRAG